MIFMKYDKGGLIQVNPYLDEFSNPCLQIFFHEVITILLKFTHHFKSFGEVKAILNGFKKKP